MSQEKLSSSVDLLADAMRKVFSETVKGVADPMATEAKTSKTGNGLPNGARQ